jgi:ribonuclease P protein component
VLPRAHRLTSTLDISRVVRRGGRFSSGSLVIHWFESEHPCRIAFVVPKTVGNAPRRNRVRRQLRELCRGWVASESGDVVVRALASAEEASWDQLSADLTRALARRESSRA